MTPDVAGTSPLQTLAEGLERMTGRLYRVDGTQVIGPGTTSLVIASHPEVTETERSAHLDIGFVLNRTRDDTTIWDCVTGFGATKVEAANSAIAAWLQTTGPVILELLTQDGTFADHYPSAQCGLPGRHAIHGALLGWGTGDGPNQLQRWWLANPLLPTLAHTIDPEEWPVFGALRVFFGSQFGRSTAEVRLNGTHLADAADLLLRQDWPRFEEPAFVRSFVLLIPEE